MPRTGGQAIHALVLAALRSFGGDDDARLAFHAEAAGDGAAVLRYAPAAARRAAGLASHREAAAQYERALRFAGGADPASLAGLHEGLADEVALLDRWDGSRCRGAGALALWREAGDRLREGGALRRLSRIRWNMCRGREAVAAAEAAVSVLEPLGPSVELARAYATLRQPADAAGRLRRRHRPGAAGPGTGRPARRHGRPQRRAQHPSRQQLGPGPGLGRADAPRARHRAGRAATMTRPARAYANLCESTPASGSSPRPSGTWPRASRTATSTTSPPTRSACAASRPTCWNAPGRWDEAVALSTQILTKAGPSPANRLCTLIRLGVIRARRGEPGIWEYLDEAAVTADEAGEPQQQVPARLARAEAHWLEGKPDAARREAELAATRAPRPTPGFAARSRPGCAALGSPRPMRGELAEPYRLLLDGDPVGAAQALDPPGLPVRSGDGPGRRAR